MRVKLCSSSNTGDDQQSFSPTLATSHVFHWMLEIFPHIIGHKTSQNVCFSPVQSHALKMFQPAPWLTELRTKKWSSCWSPAASCPARSSSTRVVHKLPQRSSAGSVTWRKTNQHQQMSGKGLNVKFAVDCPFKGSMLRPGAVALILQPGWMSAFVSIKTGLVAVSQREILISQLYN